MALRTRQEKPCPAPDRVCSADIIAEQVVQLTTELRVFATKMDANVEHLTELITKTSAEVFGNGKTGLATRIDRIEQSFLDRIKREEQFRKLGTGLTIGVSVQVLMVVAAFIWALIKMALEHGVM